MLYQGFLHRRRRAVVGGLAAALVILIVIAAEQAAPARAAPPAGHSAGTISAPAADWQLMLSGTLMRLWGVWGSSRQDVFAVGSGGIILHYNGVSWRPMVSGTHR